MSKKRKKQHKVHPQQVRATLSQQPVSGVLPSTLLPIARSSFWEAVGITLRIAGYVVFGLILILIIVVRILMLLS